jgi:hypothetical protein
MKLSILGILRFALVHVFLVGTLILLVYGVTQQAYRQGANDPQIEQAEDTAHALNRGVSATSLVSGPSIDLSTSLAPFLIITNTNYRVIASTGKLNGQTVLPPPTALAAARDNRGNAGGQTQENRLTWQPADGVREAAVITAYRGGYVISARSLREVEIRENALARDCAVAFFVIAVGGVLLVVAARRPFGIL